MTEDLDKDLEGLDLSDDSFDLGGLDDAGGDEEDAGIDLSGLDDAGGEEDAGSGPDAADLDGLEDAGGEEDAGSGLDAADLDDLGDAGGGEESSSGGDSLDLDAELQSMLDDSEGSGGDTEAADAGGELEEALGGEGAGMDGGEDTPPALPPMELSDEQTVNLEFLLDIKLHVTFEVGRAKMLISDLLTLGQGSVIELHRLVGDDLDMLVNGRLVARGEVVVVNEKFGCKINEIIPPDQRVKYMGNI
ncbi:MAG: flagellar motor switch protein FliN [bacterium]